MGLIYCFTNKENNKKYIGQTINSDKQRYSAHKSSYQRDSSSEYNSPLHRAFRKYGFENFDYEILIDGIEDLEILNKLEIFYIKFYNTQIPNGYNVEAGGRNASKTVTQERKEKLMWDQAKLTKEEVIELRVAYKNGESPSKIYNEKYKDRLHYNSFLNIWSGRRYKHVLPEYIENGRHTKLTQEKADEIRRLYKTEKFTYQQLAEKFECSKSTIADIIRGRTWKKKD